MAEKGCLKDGIFNNLEVDGLLLGKNVELTSKTSQEPVLTLKNITNDTSGPIIKFVKDKGSAGAANDVNGLIQFFGDNSNQDQIMFSELKSQVKVHTNGQEGGKLTFSVTEHDGTSTAGLIIEDGDSDGELDVTIGAGADSLTTIAGSLEVSQSLEIKSSILINRRTLYTTINTTLSNGGTIFTDRTCVSVSGGSAARTLIRFHSGPHSNGQLLIVLNIGSVNLTFHPTESSARLKGVNANNDTMLPGGAYIFVGCNNLWVLIGGSAATNGLGLDAG